ncbi:multicopper oxidase [Poronia punctata]|nr:multicopper oxidase [Poronia punctata]
MYRLAYLICSILTYAGPVLTATVTYNWEATWVWASPDGHGRPVIGINGSWPCPPIMAFVGDTIVINLLNKLGNETTGVHFHGVNQVNSNFMDGAVGTIQCPLPPGKTMTYSFMADQSGTYWYHSHNMGQYPDGFRGPMIIHDPEDPYLDEYDDDQIFTISDWYHDQSPTLVEKMIQPNNTDHRPPLPDSVLINEGDHGHVKVEADRTYRIRIINFSALTGAFVMFNALQMRIIAVDGTYTEKQIANHIRVLPAQRYDVLLTIGSSSLQNYPFLVALDTNPDYTDVHASTPISYRNNLTGQLITDATGNLKGKSSTQQFYPQDDYQLVPYDQRPAYGPVTKHWVLNFDYCDDPNGYRRACFNGTSFIGQKVPTLYSVSSLGKNNTKLSAYGQVGAFDVAYNEVLEIVINNHDDAIHPFHLHGHQFQVIERPKSNAGNWTGTRTVPKAPMRRDTVAVNPNSYVVLRILANNPGVFLLHCHVEWHVEMGLTATLIEAPELLVNYKIPRDHVDICKDQGIPISGNAAGNEVWDDMKGFVTVNPTKYLGALWSSTSSPTSSKTADYAIATVV